MVNPLGNISSVNNDTYKVVEIQEDSSAKIDRLLTCGARGPRFDSPPRHLNFRDWLTPASKVWLKYRLSDVNPQYNQPTKATIDTPFWNRI